MQANFSFHNNFFVQQFKTWTFFYYSICKSVERILTEKFQIPKNKKNSNFIHEYDINLIAKVIFIIHKN